MSKGLGFEVTGFDISRNFNFYPNLYKKSFPKKHFLKFDAMGHSYFLGKYGTMDCHIVFECNSGGCLCGESQVSYVSGDVANMIYNQIILKSFKQLGFETLTSRNVIIDEDSEYETLSQCAFTEFNMVDFGNPDFCSTFRDSCDRLKENGFEFFRNHDPYMVFLKYGQNVEIKTQDDVQRQITPDFDLTYAAQVSLSIAANNVYQAPQTEEPPNSEDEDQDEENQREEGQSRQTQRKEELREEEQRRQTQTEEEEEEDDDDETDGRVRDPDVMQIETDPPQGTQYSISFSKHGIQRMFSGVNGIYTTYTKGFNGAFCNFDAKACVPREFFNLTARGFRVHGLHGYSILAHLMRRSKESEPYFQRPLSMLFKATTKKARAKFYDKIVKDNYLIHGAVNETMRNGCGYRIEVTLTTDMHAWEQTIDLTGFWERVEVFLSKFKETVQNTVVRYAYLYPVKTFPGCIKNYTDRFIDHINEYAEFVKLSSTSNPPIQHRECVVLMECLVFFVII